MISTALKEPELPNELFCAADCPACIERKAELLKLIRHHDDWKDKKNAPSLEN